VFAGSPSAARVPAPVHGDRANQKNYASYFQAPFPTRTTVQQRPPVERRPNEKEQWPILEQISLVAVK
jgi:hypothetical protein